ncbi:MAG: tRNA lysidine(34) synthetase TilS [Thermomicrobiales bacterium]
MIERVGLPLSHMTGVEQRLLERVRARGFGPGNRVVAGFSGGGDSLALSSALARLWARGLGPAVTLFHVDHGLRDESGRDAAAAGELAHALGLPFRTARICPQALARHRGAGIEEAARRERYRALAAACREEGAAAIVLGHHRDDQAESVLLHLLRGAGTAGAAGMGEWTVREVPWWSGEEAGPAVAIWRPLLRESRAVLRDFVAGLELAPIDDPSTDETAIRRNALRLEILPALERMIPGAAAAIARHADIAAEDDAALDAWAVAALAGAAGGDGALLSAGLAGLPVAIRRRVARLWLLANARAAEPGMDRIEALLDALERNRGGAVIEIGGGERVMIERGGARVLANASEAEGAHR